MTFLLLQDDEVDTVFKCALVDVHVRFQCPVGNKHIPTKSANCLSLVFNTHPHSQRHKLCRLRENQSWNFKLTLIPKRQRNPKNIPIIWSNREISWRGRSAEWTKMLCVENSKKSTYASELCKHTHTQTDMSQDYAFSADMFTAQWRVDGDMPN